MEQISKSVSNEQEELKTHNSQPATHNSQPATRNSQPVTRNSQPIHFFTTFKAVLKS